VPLLSFGSTAAGTSPLLFRISYDVPEAAKSGPYPHFSRDGSRRDWKRFRNRL
jgi:hypothetical protein